MIETEPIRLLAVEADPGTASVRVERPAATVIHTFYLRCIYYAWW
jgi:hypothetical protein